MKDHKTTKRNDAEEAEYQDQLRRAACKRPARMALKKAINPAPKREKKPLQFGPENTGAQNHGGSSGSRQGKSGKGKRLRREQRRLDLLKLRGARPRSIKRLTATINRRGGTA